MTLIKSISGIRGTIGGHAGEGLNPLDIVKFTSAYATLIRKTTTNKSNKIVVGRDARISGEMVKNVVCGTLMGMGFDVVNIGLASTPTTELAVTMEGACGGIILTASHNPRQWNALKLLNEHGEFLNAAEGNEVLRIAAAEEFEFADIEHIGKYREDNTYNQKHIDSVLALKLVDVEAIRKAYPDIHIIGSSGPNSEGDQFDYLWPEMKKLKVDLVDEHFYRPEDWFLKSGNRYDNYDRKGPKVFAGEYACHGKGKKWNHFEASLLEAAFLTGVERNADVVYMATYAPLLAHVEGWQWRPDLIWFDNLRSVRSCSWYVQSLYGHDKGTNVVPLTMDKQPVSGQEGQNGLFASAVWDEPTQTYIVKVANVSDKAQKLNVEFKGLKKSVQLGEGTCTTLHSDNLDAENTLDNPNLIVPKESKIDIENNVLNTEIGAKTFAVYKFVKTTK